MAHRRLVDIQVTVGAQGRPSMTTMSALVMATISSLLFVLKWASTSRIE